MLLVTKAVVASGVAALAMSGTPLPDSTLESQSLAAAPVVPAHPAPMYCPSNCNLWGMLGAGH